MGPSLKEQDYQKNISARHDLQRIVWEIGGIDEKRP